MKLTKLFESVLKFEELKSGLTSRSPLPGVTKSPFLVDVLALGLDASRQAAVVVNAKVVDTWALPLQ